MEGEGYRFTRTRRGREIEIRLANGERTTFLDDIDVPHAVPINGRPALPPHPSLDQSLRVHLLAFAEDGRLKIGLSDDEGHSWLCTVDGYSGTR